MSNDVLITPASRKIEFKDSSGNVDAKLETDASGNLQITNAGGDISIGDTTSDVIIGDGTNNVDIVFEQNGEIRGTSGVTLTLGDSNTNLRVGTDLDLNNNDITNVASLPANFYSSYRRDTIDTASEDFNTYLTTGNYHVNNWSESGDTVQNGPTGSYAWGLLRVTNWMAASGTSSGTGTYVLQEYFPHNTDHCFHRTMWNGTFTSWRESWGSGSDGSGSGLDADKVDGIHGTSLLRSDASDSASGVISFTNGSNATSTSSGAVRITGGLGVGYNIYAGSIISGGSFNVGSNEVITSSRIMTNMTLGYGPTGTRFQVGGWIDSTDGDDRFYFASDSHTYYKSGGSGGKHIWRNGFDVSRAELDASGNFIAEGNITAYGSASDIRIKENIEVIPDSVKKVKSLRGVTFNYKKDGKRSTGLVAQELQKVLPEAVYETKDSAEDGEDILAIRYGNVVGLLVEALKEQQTQIDNLTALVNELKEK